jgi:hypothetical protein
MARWTKTHRQAVDIQHFAHKCLMSLQKDLQGKSITKEDANAINNIARTWEAAVERVRICKGEPLPGSYRPERKQSKVRDAFGGLDSVIQLPTPQESQKQAKDTQAVVVQSEQEKSSIKSG